MASCATQLASPHLQGRGGVSGHPEGRDPGSRLCVPRDQAPQLGKHIRQRPLASWRLLGTPGALYGSLAAKVGEDYDTTCVFLTHTHAQNHKHTTNWATSLQGFPGSLFWQPRREDRHWTDHWYLCSYELGGRNWTHAHTHSLRARSMSSQWINV